MDRIFTLGDGAHLEVNRRLYVEVCLCLDIRPYLVSSIALVRALKWDITFRVLFLRIMRQYPRVWYCAQADGGGPDGCRAEAIRVQDQPFTGSTRLINENIDRLDYLLSMQQPVAANGRPVVTYRRYEPSLEVWSCMISYEFVHERGLRGLGAPDTETLYEYLDIFEPGLGTNLRSIPHLTVQVDRDEPLAMFMIRVESYSGFLQRVVDGHRPLTAQERSIAEFTGQQLSVEVDVVNGVEQSLTRASYGSYFQQIPKTSKYTVSIHEPVFEASSERQIKFNHKLRGKTNVPFKPLDLDSSYARRVTVRREKSGQDGDC